MRNKSLILILIVLLGTLIRSYHINTFGIWIDEQATILIANGQSRYFVPDLDRFTNLQLHSQNTLAHVVEATSNDNGNSFAYNFLLHYWIGVFGESDLSIRLLSLLFGLLIIPLSYRLASEIFKNKDIALLIAFLFAIHPLFNEYSHMSRAYTMATFFSLLSSYFFYHIVTSQARNRTYLFYALSVGVSLLSHYLTSYVFIAQGIIFLLSVRDKNTWMRYIAAGILIVGIFAAWMYIGGKAGLKVLAIQNADNYAKALRYKPGQTGEAAYTLPVTAKNVFTGWAEVWLQLFGDQLEYFDLRVRMIAILLLLPFFLIFSMIRFNRRNPGQEKIIIALLIMTFTQTLYATTEALRAGHCKPFHPPYVNFAVPYALILLGYAIYTCFQNAKLKIPTIIIFSFITALMFISYIPTYRNSRKIYPDRNFFQISASEISAKYQKGDTVTIKTSVDAKLINLYLPDKIEIDQKIDSNITGLYTMSKY